MDAALKRRAIINMIMPSSTYKYDEEQHEPMYDEPKPSNWTEGII
jgi:hypothetical protein